MTRSPLPVSMMAVVLALGCGGRETATRAGTSGGVTTSSGSAGGSTGTTSSAGTNSGSTGISSGASKIPKIHRATASSCTQPRSGGDGGVPDCDAGSYGSVSCRYDSDCTAGADGRCECDIDGVFTSAKCSYDACQSDSDCVANGSSGGVCDCREGQLGTGNQSAANVCLAGNCRTDADCGSGGYCSPSNVPGCGPGWWYGYFCHTANDTCTNDTDCPRPNGVCATYGNAWTCYPSPCADGGV
jgi:hypothetical protein